MQRNTDSSRYVVVEGPIGVGKTSLARKLAESLEADLLLEEVYANPFLERFYQDGQSAALPAQMFFLFARARQIEDLRQGDMFASVRVSDYLFAKDRLFAELTLRPEELSLYAQVAQTLNIEAPVPDLVIYLQSSVDALMERIARRGPRRLERPEHQPQPRTDRQRREHGLDGLLPGLARMRCVSRLLLLLDGLDRSVDAVIAAHLYHGDALIGPADQPLGAHLRGPEYLLCLLLALGNRPLGFALRLQNLVHALAGFSACLTTRLCVCHRLPLRAAARGLKISA